MVSKVKRLSSVYPFTFLPYEHLFTKKVSEEPREWNGIKYKYVDLEHA